MTGLEPVKDNEETAAAFLYLIALAIKKYINNFISFHLFWVFKIIWFFRVPENVLKAKFDDLLRVYVEILDTHGEMATNFTLIKSVRNLK